MPRSNFYIILLTLLVYALTSGVTLQDRLLISTLHRLERTAYFEPSALNLFEGAMSGMTDVLADDYGDHYTRYIPPSHQSGYQDNLDNQYEGLGFLTRIHEADGKKQLFIGYPHYNAPAHRAGLRSGDQVVQIDNTTIAEQSNSEILELLRRQPETHLSVLPFGQTDPKNFVVLREKIRLDSVEGDYFDSDKRVFHLEAHPKIGYIRITSFSPTTAKEFGDALDSMMQSGVESFILDLRNNSGGDVSSCVQVAQMLMSPTADQNVFVTVRPRRGFEHNRTLTQGTQRCTLPMVVLIDGETASASEILAAALQDHRRATIVGTRSFGKGVIQNIIELPFQSGLLQLTVAEYRRPSGAGIHRRVNAADADDWGVLPDRVVEVSESERSAILQYRLLRSNLISAEHSAVLERFRQQIAEKQNGGKEGDALESKPLKFTGAAPYYDVQLDEAVRVLLGGDPPY